MSGPVDLTVAISTLGAGIDRIQLPEPVAGIRYLVLHQCPQQVSSVLLRADVRVVALDTVGLSNSRNAALEQAETDLLIFADDDTTLFLDGVQSLAQSLAAAPDLALAVGWRAERLPSQARRAYLTRFNSGRICAPEFMVRRSLFRTAGVRFDPDFGLGARFGLGEEYVFVTDALRAGLRGITLPVVTGSHPEESTGDLWSDPTLMAARQAVIARVFGRWALAVRAVYMLRHRHRFDSLEGRLRFVLGTGTFVRDKRSALD
ncbi:Glycosyl transferase family 2 [Tritonibacter multivorans]|uniref:Glycosyl transferase family 2 n=1 Tax=Tritonibacter multivorans TaxID=928856 RepID=A0A0P1GGP2_9RHOB|nr:glycosyltransferase [Tritonibacter multivorans]MDA7422711.1 glycosyltransferase [Tritonibacter multivorans]CUH80811.1 Glycosyl transferase family 2 [Tritonibacter multivorans]SFD55861.1 Glycosyltransferase, GT2 family [Tritonibacter multivorans]